MSVDMLQAKIRKLKNPTLVQFSPRQELIPPALMDKHREALGETPEAICAAVREFCVPILERLHGLVPAVGFDAACFLALGSQGVSLMQEMLRRARHLGFYVLLDGNFTAYGQEAAMMARSVFGAIDPGGLSHPVYECDAVTLCAYHGSDSIKPYLPYLKGESPKNVFVSIKSPNRSGREVQDLISGDRVVHTALADMTLRWSLDLFGKLGYGEVCAAVSATNSMALQQLRRKYDQLFFLVKGVDCPGGSVRTASHGFDRLGHGAIVSSGDLVLGAWRGGSGEDYVEKAVAAAEKLKDQLEDHVTVL